MIQQAHKSESTSKKLISPRARREARRLGVDINSLAGSGPNGRIVIVDIHKTQSSSEHVKVSTGTRPAGAISSMRLAVANLTSSSFATVPHYYLRAELDATPLIAMRNHFKDSQQDKTGLHVTYTDFIIKAIAIALREFPQVNSIWQGNTILPIEKSNVGLVVALSEGMLIPVISNANTLSITELASKRSMFANIARSGRLPSHAQDKAAITLSNLGNSRVDEFDAIIPIPQSSILAIGRIAPRPVALNDSVCVRNTMKMTLCADHRVYDGSLGAEFIGRIVELLEDKNLLIWPDLRLLGKI